MLEFELKVFEGKIGYERWIKNYNLRCFKTPIPRIGEKIVIEGVMYTIIDAIIDYDLDEFNVFVEKFNYDDVGE